MFLRCPVHKNGKGGWRYLGTDRWTDGQNIMPPAIAIACAKAYKKTIIQTVNFMSFAIGKRT